ncbi:MAG: sulfocyanin-like copper-binding protein [Chloroflexota bacterium]
MNTRPLAILIAFAVIASSCASQPEALPADVQVVVDMKDYTITLSVATVKAGSVKFGIRNLGGMEHQFDLIRTDVAVDKLPTDGNAKAREDGLVKQVKGIGSGKVATISADLTPGRYLIICNVTGHYQLGMRVELRVE